MPSRPRPTYSCIRCADRKVKCDRQKPCSACVKHNVDCVFNAEPPPRTLRKRVRYQALIGRLERYEALLQAEGIDTSQLGDTSEPEPRRRSSPTVGAIPQDFQIQTRFIEPEPSRDANKTQVVLSQGRSKFVDNSLWTRVVEELQTPEEVLEDSSSDTSDSEGSGDDFSFVLHAQTSPSPRSRHPSPDHVLLLFQVFVENVDPLTKIVHVPTLRTVMQKASSNLKNVPRSFEALMFAIYGAAVMSMKDEECQQRFREPRKNLLSRYVSATKAALSRAKFMGTNSLVVLQALLLHLISVRDVYEPRALWSLTAVALRIAQGMGLESDGASLGLPPFDTEMRRRVWWLLKTHDYQTAELCGFTKFRDLDTSLESTKWPKNVNDDQLYPGMSSFPIASVKLTDMAFIALRGDLVNFASRRVARFRQQGKSSSHWDLHASGSDKLEIEAASREMEEVLETKYLRYCDPSQPLHFMVMLIARLSMNIVYFRTNHPRRWASIEQTPPSERQWVWETSLKLLEQHNMVQTNPQIRQFAWHASFYVQWHALIHVLDTLRATPLTADADKAWKLVGNTYESNPDMIYNTKKPIHVAVSKLCLRAYDAREPVFQNKNTRPHSPPEFIQQLRQQHEATKVKMQARSAKSNRAQGSIRNSKANDHCLPPRPDTVGSNSESTLQSVHFTQSTRSQPPNAEQFGMYTEDDTFWSLHGFNESQNGDSNDVMNLDLDFQYAEGNDQPINWEQWDAWLVNSNATR